MSRTDNRATAIGRCPSTRHAWRVFYTRSKLEFTKYLPNSIEVYTTAKMTARNGCVSEDLECRDLKRCLPWHEISVVGLYRF